MFLIPVTARRGATIHGALAQSRSSTGTNLSSPNQPSRDASAYAHWEAWPSAPDPSLNSRCPHTHDSSFQRHARCSRWDRGPWTHAHPPCWHATPCPARDSASPPELRHSASLHHRTIRHLGSAPLCTAVPLYTSLHRAPLCATISRTVAFTSLHRCISLHLSVCSLQLCAKCWIDALTESPGYQLRHGVLA